MNAYHPKRRPRHHSGIRDETSGDIPGHRAFVRKHTCIVPGCDQGPIECCHVRAGIDPDGRGGTGLKPHDKWTFPGCHEHHAEQHRIGEKAFAAKYKINPIETAKALWQADTYHRTKYEMRDRT